MLTPEEIVRSRQNRKNRDQIAAAAAYNSSLISIIEELRPLVVAQLRRDDYPTDMHFGWLLVDGREVVSWRVSYTYEDDSRYSFLADGRFVDTRAGSVPYTRIVETTQIETNDLGDIAIQLVLRLPEHNRSSYLLRIARCQSAFSQASKRFSRA